MKNDKVIVTPASQRQLENWIERLQDAGCQYQELTYKGKDVLEVDRIDAVNILGQTQLKKTSSKKVAAIVIGSLLVLGWIGSLADKSEKTTTLGATIETPAPLSIDDQRRQDSIRTIQNNENTLIAINAAIQNMKTFNKEEYRGSIESVMREVALFQEWAKLIEDSERSSDAAVIAAGNKLRKPSIAIQVKEFPRMRAEYAKQAHQIFWRNDIEVAAIGKGNTTIRFIGGLFAANSNKEDFQKTAVEALTLLRFKQSRYLWHELDDEYTYWKISSANDGDLVAR